MIVASTSPANSSSARTAQPTAGAQTLEARLLREVFSRLLAARIVLGGFALGLGTWVAWLDDGTFRRAVLFAVPAVVILASLRFWGRARKRADTERQRWHDFALIVPVQAAALLATGGMQSPILPSLLLLSLALGLLLPPRQAHLLLFGLQLPLLVLVAVIDQAGIIAPLLPKPWRVESGGISSAGRWATALVAVALVAICGSLATTLRGAFARLLDQTLLAQDHHVREYATRSSEMMALSAEIAHELKNPLTTIRALADMLHRQYASAAAQLTPEQHYKGVTRLAMMAQEARKMEEILNEFLNYSRPLAPLTKCDVDIVDLVAQVVSLHEGYAGKHQTSIDLVPWHGSLSVLGDRRKLSQILTNILQNAIEHSRPGGGIRMRTEARDGTVVVSVADDGEGLDESLAAELFTPGMTTKPGGSGIGLTVARALARQHDGDLTLANRDDGPRGCIAQLRLPAAN